MALQRILALTGPSGVGKTATIRALAASSNIEIVEWKTGLDDWKLGDSESFIDGKLCFCLRSIGCESNASAKTGFRSPENWSTS